MIFLLLRYSLRCCQFVFSLMLYLYSSGVFSQELESAAIYVGPFDVIPTLDINVENNDNVFLEGRGNERSATLTTLAPQISAIGGDEVVRYELEYSLENGRYSGVENTDYTDHKFGANVAWRPDIRHLIELGVSESRGHDERSVDGVSGLSANQLDKTKDNELSANYTFGSEGARGRLIIGFKTNSLRYTTNQATTNVLESNTDTTIVNLSIGVGARTRALVEVTNVKNAFHSRVQNNRQDQSYAVGVEWELSDLMKGAILVGRSNSDLLNAAGDTSSSIGQASIAWSPLEYSVFTLTANEGAENTENNIGSFVDRSRVELGWNYQVNDQLAVITSLGRQRDDFINDNRQDTTNDSQIKLNYAFRRWLSMSLGFSTEKRTSSDTSSNYDNNKVVLSVNTSL